MPGIYMVMGDTAEVVAKRYNITRETQDRYSLLSQQRTARAPAGRLLQGRDGADAGQRAASSTRRRARSSAREPYYVDKDECNRADTTLEGLLKLPPHFDKDERQGHRHRRQLLAALRRRLAPRS